LIALSLKELFFALSLPFSTSYPQFYPNKIGTHPAIGMSKWKAVFYIILPQALRLAIPAWANEPVSLLKATSVVFLIAVPELMTRAKLIASRTYDPISSYLAVAILYLVLVYLVDFVLKWLERRTRLPGLSAVGEH